ncbi:preprotein translocase subunit YajC [Nocardioides sp. CBS4Y-1]|uniref:Preprotein translocase subunit YajC n=1 Tax=Nocardioides acrostichi TaxID=2784339 RepID=A0A930YB88_9ACTN|nr:preprotein translocase subunit YajC [Nocardioides acrostichi]
MLPLLVIAVIFWLLIVRPQTRRNRELMTMQRSLGVGDEVMLTSGVYGILRALDDPDDPDDTAVSVEIADGVVIRVARAAVGQKVAPLAGTEDEQATDLTLDKNPDPTSDEEN